MRFPLLPVLAVPPSENVRSRCPSGGCVALVLFLLGTLAASSYAADKGPGDPLNLIGTWHILVHYRDDNTVRPYQLRWDDRVWVFEPTQSRMRWREYPIVVFQDKQGRFKRLGGSGATRVLHAWKPNEGQLAQIREGLEVNSRGSKSKTLRRSGEGGWRSTRMRRSVGVAVVDYQENWIIEGTPGMPAFRREDVLSTGRVTGPFS